MTTIKEVDDPAAVTAFIKKLKPGFSELVHDIREVIIETDPQIGQHIKWNSPAFFYKGEMKPFNAKEYKRDLLVINVNKGIALLIFPTGASIKDDSGTLEGVYTDGRRMVTIRNAEELAEKKIRLQEIIRKWLLLAAQ